LAINPGYVGLCVRPIEPTTVAMNRRIIENEYHAGMDFSEKNYLGYPGQSIARQLREQ